MDLVQNAKVPRPKNLTHPVPCLYQPAFGHREMQVVIVDIQNLAQRRTLEVVHHPRQTDSMVADLAVR